jgi:hypothetical protein
MQPLKSFINNIRGEKTDTHTHNLPLANEGGKMKKRKIMIEEEGKGLPSDQQSAELGDLKSPSWQHMPSQQDTHLPADCSKTHNTKTSV